MQHRQHNPLGTGVAKECSMTNPLTCWSGKSARPRCGPCGSRTSRPKKADSAQVRQMAEAGEADKELEVPKDGTMDLIACLDALPTSELTSLESITSKACTICLDAYAVGDQVKTLACGCVFHGGCMEQWGQANDGCQQCGKPWRPAVSAHHRTMASDQCTNRLSE
ncbi:unnamed protein product [Durusdinium trenchii]|uniref:RING-type domain-containing protein n=1 Tax=Durusdinium trenchii TaxID=1381693 RepID=A0ABP0I3C3_9DINO